MITFSRLNFVFCILGIGTVGAFIGFVIGFFTGHYAGFAMCMDHHDCDCKPKK